MYEREIGTIKKIANQ